ncbi:MAG: helix-turn-helix transcriptional regulator [Betaproteobacteria bacterium]|nr:helix-turn-helix domain-containing protein [Betaproteobacteria bacterium]MDE1956331.1 helix-turn-helix transcriptional regulator [Betaproteobacteria bacterium]MDE2152177.1 helix-turn-helix transcriptional regulator [Betaproteobacteria bacterium]
MSKTAPVSSDALLPQLADLFRLLGDNTRLRIVTACLQGPVAVGDIASGLELAPTLVSHHLRLLRAARLVKSERQGKHVLYSTADQHVARMLGDMLEHIAEPAGEIE